MVLDYIMGRIGVYYIEYINPFIVILAWIFNPIITIIFAIKYSSEF